MQNRFIVSPFFLDQAVSGLRELVQPNWVMNSPSLPKGNTQTRMSVLHRPLADFVAKTSANGERAVSIMGDCCSAIGVLAGLQRNGIQPTLLWFDAHGDFNTWETTPSGFLGGMPLAMMVGRGDQTLVNAVELNPFPETDIILTDARDLDPGEQDLLKMSDVHHLNEISALLDYSFQKDSPLYIDFDTDILTPDEAPAMNYLAPGGPSVNEMAEVFRHLAQNNRIIAVSMTCWNPELDKDEQSQQVCMELLHTLIGTK